MKKIIVLSILVLSSISFINSCVSKNEPAITINLPSIFSSNMVLQANKEINIWGKATPNTSVEVWINDNRGWAESDDLGDFYLILDRMNYGGPFDLFVAGKDTTVFSNVLIGEVWLCSGQSNMEWTVSRSDNAEKEISSANFDNIRLFTVPKVVANTPQHDCAGEWSVCSSENVGAYSAVGYFFGRELFENLDVPIGLIHSSWGGTPVEAWMEYNTLAADEDFLPIIDRYQNDLKDYPDKIKIYNELVAKMENDGNSLPMYQKDKGNVGYGNGWAKLEYDDSEWDEIELPSVWEVSLNLNADGVLWFRKEVSIPESWQNKELFIELGAIDDLDVTYFNGVKIGETTEETPNFWSVSRKYTIPAKLVKTGKSVIAIRVFDHFGEGGFTGSKVQLKMYQKADQLQMIELAGIWKYKIEIELDPNNVTGPGANNLPPMPRGPGHSHSPAGLYNAMIYPVAPYTLNGFIWYQGETNASRAFQYRKLLPAMIKDWRTTWDDNSLYFGIVQLANYMAVQENPSESAWAELREAQMMTAINDPLNGLAVIIDIGEADDIHPTNKQDVGKRLAYWSLNKAYEKKGFNNGTDNFSGPLYKSMIIERDKIRIKFDFTADGLRIKDSNELKGFEISGREQNFLWANALIDGDEIIVSNENIKDPVAVRYAWANNPVCNLYNSTWLPAIPFRTDKWPGVTDKTR